MLWWTSDTQQKLSLITEQQTYLNASLLLAENEAWSTGETLPLWLWWRRRSSSYHRCSCSEHEECAGTSQGWPETENTTHTLSGRHESVSTAMFVLSDELCMLTHYKLIIPLLLLLLLALCVFNMGVFLLRSSCGSETGALASHWAVWVSAANFFGSS